MKLGAFSVSLAVKDIHVSSAFYQKLGFSKIGGDIEQGWLILRNNQHTIGLFQGMFEQNTLTFNPGWDEQNQPLPEFNDIRELYTEFTNNGLEVDGDVNVNEQGPASFVVIDPDGNPILFDQHC